MSTSFKRADRIAGLIQRELADLIRKEVKDPRLPAILSFSAVKLSADLSHAQVYFTAFDADIKKVELVLNQATPFLRSALAGRLRLRTVPQLHFVYDKSIEYARHMNQLIGGLDIPDEDASSSLPDEARDS